ncbi:hypothetical protein J2T10_001806 [Paenarthrobacter nicotinovorans]|uniref:Uncharacterized protein n=1 Tax=Paenarthrobacter nicotinovorans TaxID=29320 RepID=A0ABT9TKI2_PAENI|nr:hypothetical protein [Paenarthrobacter nicotinovorans]MDQ0102160.1 hypothetical protein [Paenarthrobacter nicotinovorans]
MKDPVAEHATETVVAVILHDESVPQLESGTTLNGTPRRPVKDRPVDASTGRDAAK